MNAYISLHLMADIRGLENKINRQQMVPLPGMPIGRRRPERKVATGNSFEVFAKQTLSHGSFTDAK
jgi:hypothetical protein